MTEPTARNRLDEEESPYLRQHADNPVNWQPWDEQALAAARERDVPIFLSVGYSACHWCHVMEEESFEDEEVAAVLNEQFVPIKVDREERPDVDSIYQTVCQLVSGRGGWPLSAWLTPEGKPFYVGTYFPKEPKRGMPGFTDLLERIAESWSDPQDRTEMENRADQWTDAARGQLEETPGAGGERPGADLLAETARKLLGAADREHGGFGTSGPKFPHPGRIHLLLRAGERTGREAYREVATETLDAMADGGMYDHVGGGFHRYATDRDWTVPHFEKMLYDNAELPRAYLAGYQATGEKRYARVARETFAFVEREMTHPDGGFYSTLDARSPVPGTGGGGDGDGAHDGDHEEGAFYVWTPEGVREAIESADDELLDRMTTDLLCDRFGITERGNFEGATVLTVETQIEQLAAEYDLDPGAVRRRLEAGRERLFAARSERPRPRRDEKVLAGWNGLMISALAEGAIVLEECDPDGTYAGMATDALAFAREHLWDPAAGPDGLGRLSRRYKDGEVKIDGYLEDYAFLARGAFDCYGATGAVEHLEFALDLARVIEAEFYDDERATLYFTPESGEGLVTRPQELRDQSTPSSLGVAVGTLLSLAHFSDGDAFGSIAETVLGTHGDRIRSSPIEYVTLATAAERHAAGDLELTLSAAELPAQWRQRLASTYLPDRLLAPRPPTEDGLAEWLAALDLSEAPPIWAGRQARDGRPTVYACRSFTCSPPEHDLEAALEWARENAPTQTDDQ